MSGHVPFGLQAGPVELSARGVNRRVIVCGGRDFTDRLVVYSTLDDLSLARGTTIMHGGASGADAIADGWARDNHCKVEVYSADWSKGRSAISA